MQIYRGYSFFLHICLSLSEHLGRFFPFSSFWGDLSLKGCHIHNGDMLRLVHKKEEDHTTEMLSYVQMLFFLLPCWVSVLKAKLAQMCTVQTSVASDLEKLWNVHFLQKSLGQPYTLCIREYVRVHSGPSDINGNFQWPHGLLHTSTTRLQGHQFQTDYKV